MMGVTAITAAVLAASIVIPPGGLWGPVPGAGTTVPVASAGLPRADGPRSTADMATVNPGATLTTDEFDAVIAASAAEASKTSAPVAHVHEPPAQPEAAPEPRAATKKPAAKKPVAKKPVAKKPAAVVYTCPMHPEVTSSKPGTCPKCGMALVKK